MNAADYLGMYAEGWTKGDVDTILKSVADEFVFDDPNDGKITRDDFPAYLDRVREIMRSLLDGNSPNHSLKCQK